MWGIGRGADALGLSKLAGPVEYHGYLGAVQLVLTDARIREESSFCWTA
jgi:hypothetical protein